jgi:hypothetical protein
MLGLEENKSGSDNLGHTLAEGLFDIFGDGIGDMLTDEGGLIALAVLAVTIILTVVLRIAYESWSGSPPNPLG